MTDPIEAMARGLHAIEESWNDYEWEYLPPTVQKLFMEQATAARDAHLAALSETHVVETQAERQVAIDAAHARGVAEERERAAGKVMDHLYPTNPQDDWTEYEAIKAGFAVSTVAAIREQDQ